MSNKWLRRIALVLVLAIALCGVALAQDTVMIQRSVVPSGVATGAAGDIILTSYVGESMATSMVGAGAVREGSGFLQEGVGKYWRWVSNALLAE